MYPFSTALKLFPLPLSVSLLYFFSLSFSCLKSVVKLFIDIEWCLIMLKVYGTQRFKGSAKAPCKSTRWKSDENSTWRLVKFIIQDFSFLFSILLPAENIQTRKILYSVLLPALDGVRSNTEHIKLISKIHASMKLKKKRAPKA